MTTRHVSHSLPYISVLSLAFLLVFLFFSGRDFHPDVLSEASQEGLAPLKAALVESSETVKSSLDNRVVHPASSFWAFIKPAQAQGTELVEGDMAMPPPDEALATPAQDTGGYSIQAVLRPRRSAVIASAIEAKIKKFNVENGDTFKSGKVLIEYDCSYDYARLREAKARQRITANQLSAYEKLREMDSVSQIEALVARENDEQNKALVAQIEARLALCSVRAPYDGRVTNKTASQHEFVQTGRVLMEISSREPLRAEFLVPSRWLRWMNISTPVSINVNETGRSYDALIVGIHGEVDPVSQSVQVVAEMESYHEELLAGMSGRAVFAPQVVAGSEGKGFLGLVLQPMGLETDDKPKR